MKLKEYLNTNNISIEAFAVKMGLTYHTLVSYISGRRRPTQNTARRILEATEGKVTIKDLRGE